MQAVNARRCATPATREDAVFTTPAPNRKASALSDTRLSRVGTRTARTWGTPFRW